MDVNYQKKRFNITEAIDFVTAGDVSELSNLSEDEEYDNDDNQMHLDAGDIETFKAKESDNEKENFSDEDDIPLAQLADMDKETNESVDADAAVSVSEPKRVFRWRKKDTIERDVTFTSKFSDPPVELPTPFQYFRMFFPSALDDIIAEQTNLYSVLKSNRNAKTTPAEISILIGIMMKMGIVQLPSYRLYWSQSFRYETIAQVMPKNRFQELLNNLHFVNNLEIEKTINLQK